MEGYSIQKNGKWLTGNIEKGRYEFTGNAEKRYVFDTEDQTIMISKEYTGTIVINEYNQFIVYPETDDLCSFCCCSLAYGYVLYKDHKFCSIECVNEVN